MTSTRDNEPDLTLTYADHACGQLDVHLPAGGPEPVSARGVVLLVHGGFWKASYDRTHTRPQARALADLGHVVVTPEYRRVGSRLRHPRAGGVAWPVPGDDVRAALAATPALLAEHGVEEAVAHGPVTALGHSAGGQLVLWLAATGAPVARVVALAPVGDLAEAERRGLGGGAVRALMGGQDVGVADPMTLLDQRPTCPVTVVHGRQDDPVPVALSRALVERHPWTELVEIDSDHMSLIDPDSAAWPHVAAAVGRGSSPA